jgi:hypothetical protein
MRHWLALSLLCLVVGCREKTTSWGPTCTVLIEKITDECKKHGTKGLWPQVCPKYLEGIKDMQKSLADTEPNGGTFKDKVDEAETRCNDSLSTYNELTKNPQDFPKN